MVSPPQYRDRKFSRQTSEVDMKINQGNTLAKRFQIDQLYYCSYQGLLHLSVHVVLLEQNTRNWISRKETKFA